MIYPWIGASTTFPFQPVFWFCQYELGQFQVFSRHWAMFMVIDILLPSIKWQRFTFSWSRTIILIYIVIYVRDNKDMNKIHNMPKGFIVTFACLVYFLIQVFDLKVHLQEIEMHVEYLLYFWWSFLRGVDRFYASFPLSRRQHAHCHAISYWCRCSFLNKNKKISFFEYMWISEISIKFVFEIISQAPTWNSSY